MLSLTSFDTLDHLHDQPSIPAPIGTSRQSTKQNLGHKKYIVAETTWPNFKEAKNPTLRSFGTAWWWFLMMIQVYQAFPGEDKPTRAPSGGTLWWIRTCIVSKAPTSCRKEGSQKCHNPFLPPPMCFATICFNCVRVLLTKGKKSQMPTIVVGINWEIQCAAEKVWILKGLHTWALRECGGSGGGVCTMYYVPECRCWWGVWYRRNHKAVSWTCICWKGDWKPAPECESSLEVASCPKPDRIATLDKTADSLLKAWQALWVSCATESPQWVILASLLNLLHHHNQLRKKKKKVPSTSPPTLISPSPQTPTPPPFQNKHRNHNFTTPWFIKTLVTQFSVIWCSTPKSAQKITNLSRPLTLSVDLNCGQRFHETKGLRKNKPPSSRGPPTCPHTTYLPTYLLTLLPFAKTVGQLVSSKQVGQTKKKEKEKGLVAI